MGQNSLTLVETWLKQKTGLFREGNAVSKLLSTKERLEFEHCLDVIFTILDEQYDGAGEKLFLGYLTSTVLQHVWKCDY